MSAKNVENPTEITEVHVAVIPHLAQAYDTVGDYRFTPDGKLRVYASDMGDWRYAFSCAIHEQIEAALLITGGIPEPMVREFDEHYEAARQGLLHFTLLAEALMTPTGEESRAHGGAIDAYRTKYHCDCEITADSEPGEDVHAPYHREHMFADAIERLVLRELDGDWGAYADAVEALPRWEPGKAHDPFSEFGEASEDADDNT